MTPRVYPPAHSLVKTFLQEERVPFAACVGVLREVSHSNVSMGFHAPAASGPRVPSPRSESASLRPHPSERPRDRARSARILSYGTAQQCHLLAVHTVRSAAFRPCTYGSKVWIVHSRRGYTPPTRCQARTRAKSGCTSWHTHRSKPCTRW